MSNSIVIYVSKRGSAGQYAEWIAEDLGCKAVPLSDAKTIDLNDYDCIIFGSWIRGSGLVDFDKFASLISREMMDRLIVYGVGIADETAENYTQVWGYSIGKIDPKNEKRIALYILGGRYMPDEVRGLDRFLMSVMKRVLVSGSTPGSKGRANFMKERIENGVDMVKRENISSLVSDAKKMISSENKQEEERN